MDAQKKRILLLWRHPPYGNGRYRELLDVALAFGVYEQDLSILFQGDGVWSLLPDQHSAAIECKSLSQMLPTLELYDVQRIFAVTGDLEQRGLAGREFKLPVQLLADDEVGSLVATHDVVLNL